MPVARIACAGFVNSDHTSLQKAIDAYEQQFRLSRPLVIETQICCRALWLLAQELIASSKLQARIYNSQKHNLDHACTLEVAGLQKAASPPANKGGVLGYTRCASRLHLPYFINGYTLAAQSPQQPRPAAAGKEVT